MSRPGNNHLNTLLAVALLSAAMLAYELTLTRLFAVAQFYHFAFMIISLALLGSGAAGSLIAVWPRMGRYPAWSAAGFALAVLFSYALLNLIPFDSYTIAWDQRQLLYLILTLFGTTLPFLFSGLVIGGLLAADAEKLHRVYAANLLGSALGCILVLPMLTWPGAAGALFISAAAGLAAAALFRIETTRPVKIVRLTALSATAITLIAVGILQPRWASLRLSPYKGLVQVLRAGDARHTISHWGTLGRIDVVESPTIHQLPGLSPRALLMTPPLQAGLLLDGDNLRPLTSLKPDDETTQIIAANVPEAIAPILRPAASDYLILEAGGGWSALLALANGAEHVTIVEGNPQVVDLLQTNYTAFIHDLYNRPDVQVITADNRTFIRRSVDQPDIIIVAFSDSFHPVTSGAYSLGEDYRYTVEALSAELDHLPANGLLIVTRWLQTPPTESLRLLLTLEAALSEQGIANPAEHIAAFRTLRTMTFVISPLPFTQTEQAAIRKFAADRSYDLVWLPTITPAEVNQWNCLPEPVYTNTFSAALADPADFIAAYDYDIRPTRDNRPFFFHYFRWQQTPEIIAGLGRSWEPFGGSGYFVLVALLIIVSLMAAILIIGPLLLKRSGSVSAPRYIRLRTLAYFLMLGLAFLFVEIPLAQRFILLIGQPVTALALVLFSILLFSGLGSWTARRWQLERALPLLVIVALITPLLVIGLDALALGWPLLIRIALTIITLAPLGYLMGIPFARGIALIEEVSPGLIPWAWAINGSASVIAGVLAVMIALSAGFTLVLLLGAAAYGMAFVAIRGLLANL